MTSSKRRHWVSVTIRHYGCWVSDLSDKFPRILADTYVSDFSDTYYNAWVVLRSRSRGTIPEQQFRAILDYLMSQYAVRDIRIVSRDDPKIKIIRVGVDDLLNKEAFRLLLEQGAEISALLPVSSADGTETTTAFFSSQKEYEEAVQALKKVFVIDTSEHSVTDDLQSFIIDNPHSLQNVLLEKKEQVLFNHMFSLADLSKRMKLVDFLSAFNRRLTKYVVR